MNIKQLRLFHEVMVTGKISQAAERLCFSQPAASKMLNALEQIIGYRLFFRANGRLNPTPEAIYLHRETIAVLQGMTRLQDSFAKAKHGQLGKLKIASIFSPAHSLLPKLASAYLNGHSELQLSLQVMNSGQVCQGVASGQFELGLIDKSYAQGCYDVVEFSLPCYCAIHREHKAASEEILSASSIDSEDWITFSPATDIYQALKASYAGIGKTFNPRIEVNGSLNALAFVEQQCGVTLIDAINLQHIKALEPRENIVYRRFSPQIHEPIKLISVNNKPLSKAAIELKREIIDALTQLCEQS
ncbi:MAG: LysR family transcriptional regulator [Pseudomonadales bacterium]|nr:LysR family transcriptional regulator [Pseudomonadales bacterium]